MDINGGGGCLYLDHQPSVSSVDIVREPDAAHLRLVIESSTREGDMRMSVPLDAEQASEIGDQLRAHAVLMDSGAEDIETDEDAPKDPDEPR